MSERIRDIQQERGWSDEELLARLVEFFDFHDHGEAFELWLDDAPQSAS
jgi:hypothetical protein